MTQKALCPKTVLFLNSLDGRYGSTYRFRALRDSLKKLPELSIVYSETETGAFSKLFEALRASFGKYDLLVTQKFNPITLTALLIARMRRIPAMVDWDDLDVGLQNNVVKRLLASICEWIGPWLATDITTHSSAIGNKLDQRHLNHQLVQQGFDDRLFHADLATREASRMKLGFTPRQKIVGHLCTLTHGGAMHLREIFQAWSKLQGDDIRFLLIGGGPLEPQVRNLTRDFALQNRLVMSGRVDHADVPTLLQCLDVSVVYMSDSEADRARVSFKVIECLAMDIPVVGRVVGETDRLFGDLIYRCGTENFPDTILKVLASSIREHSSERIRQYRWEEVTVPFQVAVEKFLRRKPECR